MRADGEHQTAALKEFAAVNTLVLECGSHCFTVDYEA